MKVPKQIKVYFKDKLVNNLAELLEYQLHTNSGQFLITFVDYIGGKYRIGGQLSSCRGYLGENLGYVKSGMINDPEFRPNYLSKCWNNYLNTSEINLNKGYSYTLIHLTKEKEVNFRKNLISFLNKKEKEAKVSPSNLIPTNIPSVFVVKGSKCWKDSAWKYMLWTFYIKTCSFDNPKDCDLGYWKIIDPHEKTLIKNIRMSPEKEVFDEKVFGNPITSRNFHNLEGFISICSGKNPPMAKVLGLNIPKEKLIFPGNVQINGKFTNIYGNYVESRIF